MIYKTARKKIKSGDILVWSGNSFFGKIIKIATRSKYTHVGIAYKLAGRLFVIEAIEGNGVRIFPASRTTPFYWIDLLDTWTKEQEERIMSHVGDPYSWFGCLKGWLGIATKKDSRWMCADFVREMLVLEEGSTPAKIVSLCESCGDKITYVE